MGCGDVVSRIAGRYRELSAIGAVVQSSKAAIKALPYLQSIAATGDKASASTIAS